MSADVFANFGALDELVQIIYQSIYKFVVVSTVTNDKWTVHVGLSDSDGRWWRGSWGEKDVKELLGSKASDRLLEQFADQLAKLFVDGELYISDWSSAPGTKIKFTVGPAANRPMHIPLEELSPSEAAAFATTILVDIALQAKSRKCRLHGSASSYEAPLPVASASSSNNAHSARPAPAGLSHQHEPESAKPVPKAPNPRFADGPVSKSDNPSRQDTGDVRQAHPVEAAGSSKQRLDKKRTSPPDAPQPQASAPKPRPHKGASLANPNKKARKYQAIEFASDSE